MPIVLGKTELKELGCKFIVMNVPIFAAKSDAKDIHLMKTINFTSKEEVATYFSKNLPVVIFDMTGVYPDKKFINDQTGYCVRCCPIPYNDFESIRNNAKEAQHLNFTFNVDFSCW
jgi:hypothetical protein